MSQSFSREGNSELLQKESIWPWVPRTVVQFVHCVMQEAGSHLSTRQRGPVMWCSTQVPQPSTLASGYVWHSELPPDGLGEGHGRAGVKSSLPSILVPSWLAKDTRSQMEQQRKFASWCLKGIVFPIQLSEDSEKQKGRHLLTEKHPINALESENCTIWNLLSVEALRVPLGVTPAIFSVIPRLTPNSLCPHSWDLLSYRQLGV